MCCQQVALTASRLQSATLPIKAGAHLQKSLRYQHLHTDCTTDIRLYIVKAVQHIYVFMHMWSSCNKYPNQKSSLKTSYGTNSVAIYLTEQSMLLLTFNWPVSRWEDNSAPWFLWLTQETKFIQNFYAEIKSHKKNTGTAEGQSLDTRSAGVWQTINLSLELPVELTSSSPKRSLTSCQTQPEKLAPGQCSGSKEKALAVNLCAAAGPAPPSPHNPTPSFCYWGGDGYLPAVQSLWHAAEHPRMHINSAQCLYIPHALSAQQWSGEKKNYFSTKRKVRKQTKWLPALSVRQRSRSELSIYS